MPLSLARSRRFLLAALAPLCLLSAAPSAFASHLGVDDPADGEPTVSGQPTAPDVSRLDIDYDPAGSLTLTVRFYTPLDQIDTSQNYAFYSNFTVGHPERGYTPTGQRGYNCSTSAQGDLNGQHHVWNAYNSTFYDQAAVTGYDGLLKFTRTLAEDKKSITITASGPVIAARDYSCATYVLRGRRRGPAENINTRYDETCDCWYFAQDYDVVGEERTAIDTSPPLYFDGRTPPPLPACDDGIDNDGDDRTDSTSDPACAGDPEGATETEACRDGKDNDGDGKADLNDPGCKGNADRTSESDPAPRGSRTRATVKALTGCGVRINVAVSPHLQPAAVFPYSKVELRLQGTAGRARGFSRRRAITPRMRNGSATTRWRRLRPGRYSVKALYPGDSWRNPSRATRRTVTLRPDNCPSGKR